MKQIYFLISAMFIGTLANAQVKMPVQAAKDVQASSVYLNTEAPVQAARAVFWSQTIVMWMIAVTGLLTMQLMK